MTLLRRPPASFLHVLGGFVLGSLAFVLIRALGLALLPGACEGHTVLALIPPLLLGPGGIALATSQINKPRWAALGVGLAISSLFPALLLGVRDISHLRTQGCAGGYVVFGTPSGKSLPELTLRPGESAVVTVRPGGFQGVQEAVRLSATAPQDVLSTSLSPLSVAPNTPATLRLRAAENAPVQQYTVDVTAQQGQRRADGQLTVTIRR
ncbi:hypothetical protein DKM44_04065 [Deinococcus irradiatisoli]|uniref:Uncharacterized protein n=1 Tax=Deinococcus irradiatisoli TaxID=2202254 RepID=A0A2Z3JBV2_9DEIO|nr:hypothetical protein [Deinococcus irradiatisoli]AWN22512.1 hypothetical protein DKM44_04065 [Deinococcus irradiatisoli]